MSRIVECVPNFSEGNNPQIIKQITDTIAAVPGVKLLNVDPGKATNRTVVTFVGEVEAVIEAAFQGIKMAAELIDMTQTLWGAPAHGRYRCLSANSNFRHQHGRNRPLRPAFSRTRRV